MLHPLPRIFVRNSVMIGISRQYLSRFKRHRSGREPVAEELAVCSFYMPADEINAKLPRSQTVQA